MDVIYQEIGERVKNVRIMRNQSREQLADLTGVSPKFLYEIERGGKGFSTKILYKLAKALEVDSDYLLFGEEKGVIDKKLLKVIKLFDESQIERISVILKKIYEML